MDKLIAFIPSKYFPAKNTQAYKFLCLLAGGDSVHHDVILRELSSDPRSARQHLVSDGLGLHWNIINSGSKKAIYSLDSRHLRTTYQKVVPNIDLTQEFSCHECGYEQEMEVPFTTDFFWPKQ